jgi:hypothetical protein
VDVSHVVEYKRGTLDMGDHISLLVLDDQGNPTKRSDYHGLISEFNLIEGSLDD